MALQKASPYDPCFSFLDPQTGFAYLCTQDRCFVWSFTSVSLFELAAADALC